MWNSLAPGFAALDPVVRVDVGTQALVPEAQRAETIPTGLQNALVEDACMDERS